MLILPSRHLTIPPRGPMQFPGLFDNAYLDKVLATNPLAVWTLNDRSGTVATEIVHGWNGTYSNVTLGQTGIGDGGTSALFNGTTGFVNLNSAEIIANFNTVAGTMITWFKASGPGIWTDGLARTVMSMNQSGSNLIRMFKSAVSNRFDIIRIAGGVQKNVSLITTSSTAWNMFGITWDEVADQLKGYMNAVQQGTTTTNIGTFVGPLSSTGEVIGANNSTPTGLASGYIAYGGLWTRALTGSEFTSLATVP